MVTDRVSQALLRLAGTTVPALLRRAALLALVCLPSLAPAATNVALQVTQVTTSQITVIVNSDFHQRFGLSFPVTYIVGYVSGSDSVQAFARSSSANPWRRIRERDSSEFFNGEEAVRFDRLAAKAYVSVGFEPASDTLFIRMGDGQSAPVQMSFQSVAKYYDNRQAAVLLSADDWYRNGPFPKAISIFRSFNLWTTAAVITAWCDSLCWKEIQREADSGFVEIASHTRHHPYVPYADSVGEVIGSRDDILSHLTLPPAFTAGNKQFVYTYVGPYGGYTPGIDTLVSQGKYIISRISTSNLMDFSPWQSSLEKFAAYGFSMELGNAAAGGTNLATLNGAFDRVLLRGGIYHMVCHPRDLEATNEWIQPYMNGHLGYISNRNNIWYTGYGLLYVYHLLQQNVQVSYLSTVSLNAGWNMVAVPLVAPDMSLPALFPSARTNAFSWDGTYAADTVLSTGQGYWLRSESSATVAVIGVPPATTTVSLHQGWNLIGALNRPASAGAVLTTPAGILTTSFYGFNGTYTKAATLQPGAAYWVKASQAGVLTIPSGAVGKAAATLAEASTADWLTLEFRDNLHHAVVLSLAPAQTPAAGRTQELPPFPPAGVFDVRFASNMAVESLPDSGIGSYALRLSSLQGPLTVTLRNSRGRSLLLKDQLLNTSTTLKEGVSVVLSRAAEKIVLEASVAAQPETPGSFELLQNYPNPFNPTTIIKYALPGDAKVRLVVYNVLGQAVAVLVNEVQQAGSHAVEFNAAGLASGTYFCRLEAGSKTGVMKMLKVK